MSKKWIVFICVVAGLVAISAANGFLAVIPFVGWIVFLALGVTATRRFTQNLAVKEPPLWQSALISASLGLAIMWLLIESQGWFGATAIGIVTSTIIFGIFMLRRWGQARSNRQHSATTSAPAPTTNESQVIINTLAPGLARGRSSAGLVFFSESEMADVIGLQGRVRLLSWATAIDGAGSAQKPPLLVFNDNDGSEFWIYEQDSLSLLS